MRIVVAGRMFCGASSFGRRPVVQVLVGRFGKAFFAGQFAEDVRDGRPFEASSGWLMLRTFG